MKVKLKGKKNPSKCCPLKAKEVPYVSLVNVDGEGLLQRGQTT